MVERRYVLKVLGAALVVSACGDEDDGSTTRFVDPSSSSSSGGGGSSEPDFPEGYIVLQMAADLPVGSLVQVGGRSLFLGRDAGGFYAMSGSCTHQQCSLIADVSPTDITCHCHGSRFDKNGTVLAGPANTPLPHYFLIFDEDGNVGIDISQVVDSDMRATPP